MKSLGSLRSLRWKLIQALSGRKKVSSRGLEFTLQNDNWITEYRWKTFNSKEPEMLDWIDQTCRPGDIFFDIGANIGLYSLYAALRHSGLHVYAFEPEYANLHLLRDNVAANHLEDRISIYALGLSDHTGLSQLHVQDLTPGAALHSESFETLQSTRSGKSVVFREGISVYTLDDFCRAAGVVPHTLKLDVDGTEAHVLNGALETLQSDQLRSMIAEISLENGIDLQCYALLDRMQLVRHFEKKVATSSIGIWRPKLDRLRLASRR